MKITLVHNRYQLLFIALFLLCFFNKSTPISALEHSTFTLNLQPSTLKIGPQYTGEILHITSHFSQGSLIKPQDPFGLIFVVKGPKKNISLKKDVKKWGVWQNGKTYSFIQTPLYYYIAANKPLEKITRQKNYTTLKIGADNLNYQMKGDHLTKDLVENFIAVMKGKGFYETEPRPISFENDQATFSLKLPAQFAKGCYEVEAYLFDSNSQLLEKQIKEIWAKPSSAIKFFDDIIHNHAKIYGLLCVLLAIFLGALGRFLPFIIKIAKKPFQR